VEVSDPIRAHPISSSPWLICLRSGQSEESKRLTYSAFFTDKYVSSRYSAIVDHCEEQVYHLFKFGYTAPATRIQDECPLSTCPVVGIHLALSDHCPRLEYNKWPMRHIRE
jgi:hypothetical protein